MKIGLTICEYNPFHNGHLYSISQIKEQLNPDATVVIMSGNFTQRGEIAVMHKYQRAKHAIMAGADIVIELPTVFATAPAEIFAKGAVKLLSSLKGEKHLCFGIESGDKAGLLATATALSSESKEFKKLVKEFLKEGVSPAKAKQLALEKLNPPDIDLGFTLSPNNILALEYTKSIIEEGYSMDILPILRRGTGYKDKSAKENIASALGIRALIEEGKIKKCKGLTPDYVYEDLPKALPNVSDAVMIALNKATKEELSQITDCTEGLENRIKAHLKDCFELKELINKIATKRYTATRISRITLSALLGTSDAFMRKCLKSPLYLKVLAINEDRLDLLSSLSGEPPFIMRKSDTAKLSNVALKCFELDVKANDIYNQITKTKTNEFETKIVKVGL